MKKQTKSLVNSKVIKDWYKRYNRPLNVFGVVLVILLILGIPIAYNQLKSVLADSGSLLTVSRRFGQDSRPYTTKVFKTTSDHWGYTWSYDCTGVGKFAPVLMIIEDKNGSPDGSNFGVVIQPDTTKHRKASGTEQESKHGTFKLFIGTTCAWHIQVFNNAGPTQSTIPGSANAASAASASQSTTAQPNPPQPQVLLDLSGNGNQQTQPFTAAGDWTLTYTYDCSGFGQAGNFIAGVMNNEGTVNSDTGPNEQGMSGGTTDYYYDSGQHYLSITSECSWRVVVKG